MTLLEYKQKHKLTYDQLSADTGVPRTTIKYWLDSGATVKAKGSTLLAIHPDNGPLWERPE